MNAAKVICSSLRHIVFNRGSAQSGASFVVVSIIEILVPLVGPTVDDYGKPVRASIEHPLSTRATTDNAGYTKGYFDCQTDPGFKASVNSSPHRASGWRSLREALKPDGTIPAIPK